MILVDHVLWLQSPMLEATIREVSSLTRLRLHALLMRCHIFHAICDGLAGSERMWLAGKGGQPSVWDAFTNDSIGSFGPRRWA